MSFGFGFGFPKRLTSGGGLSPRLYLDFIGTGVLPSTVTFSRGTNATLTDSNGRVAWAPHNLLTNSEDFEAAAWTKVAATVTANAAVAPDGTTTADFLQEDTTTSTHNVALSVNFQAVPTTASVYVRKTSTRNAMIYMFTASGFAGGVLDVATGTSSVFAGSLAGTTTSVTDAGLYWRISVTATMFALAGQVNVYAMNGSTASYTGNGTSGIFIWGAQLNVANAPVNLLTWSEDFTNAAWLKIQLGVAAVPVVTANAGVAPDGLTTADRIQFDCVNVSSVANRSLLTAAPTYILGATYTPSIYIKAFDAANVGKTIRFYSDGLANGVIHTLTADWARVSFTSNSTLTGASNFLIETRGTFTTQTADILIWGAQLNTGSTALPYVATTSSIYLPPAYNSTTPKNLLGFTQEPENAAWTKSNSYVQQNLLTWSEDFSNAVWALDNGAALNPVVTANAGVAPNGSTTADRIVFNRTGGTFSRIQQSAVSTIGLQYTFSVWMKTFTAGTTANVGIRVDLNGVNCVVTENWTRFTVTTTTTAGSTAGQILLFSSIPGNDLTADVLVWGAQLVQGSTAGDYTQTTSAAAPTRYLNWDGTLTGRKLVEDTAAATTHRILNSVGVTVPTNGAAANIVYAKAGERTAVRLTDNDIQGADFDLLTGAVSNIGSGVTAAATSVGGGWWRLSVIRTNSTGVGRVVLYLISGGTITYTGDGTSGIYVSDFQLSNSASVDPYVYNPQAAAASAAYYGPRFDYDPVTLAAKGLLIEEQRTNLLTYSEQFDIAAWVNNGGTVTANALVAPDGTTTADYLVRSTASVDGRYQVIAAGTSGIVTASVYIKKDTSPQSLLWLYDATAVADRIFATVTWSGATPVITATTGTAATPQDTGNGWWRIAITSTALTGANTNRLYLLPAYTAASNGQQTAFWGAQLEQGAFSTSYIPTVASQVTRNADSASMLGDNFYTWYNPNQGTLSAEVLPNAVAADTRIAAIDDGTSANRLLLWGAASGSSTRYEVITGGATQVALTVNGTLTANAINKSVGAYALNNFAFSVNGGATLTDTVGTVPAGVRFFVIGGSSGVTFGSNCIRRIGYYNTRLPDSTLTALTT